MSPEELKHKSARVLNNIEPSIEADLTELDILQASENLEAYQEETRKWRNKKVANREIAEGDWVLRRKPNAEAICKLQSNWDGPYIVLYSNRPGSYHLADIEGNELQHSWNAGSLKKYRV